MHPIRNFLILFLLALRLLHGLELQKFSEIALSWSQIGASAYAEGKKSLGTSHSKKKTRISSALQERKIKHKAAGQYKTTSFTLSHLRMHHGSANCFFQQHASLIAAVQNSLHLLYPF